MRRVIRKKRIPEDHPFAPVAKDYTKEMRRPPKPRRPLKSYRKPSGVMGERRDLT